MGPASDRDKSGLPSSRPVGIRPAAEHQGKKKKKWPGGCSRGAGYAGGPGHGCARPGARTGPVPRRAPAGAAEPGRGAGVELGGFPGLMTKSCSPSPAAAAGQHVHPLISLVALLVAFGLTRRDDHLVGAYPAGLAGQRDEGAAVAPQRPGADARIGRRWRADQFVQRHLIRTGQGQQQLQGRLAAAGFQPGQGAHRDAGQLRSPASMTPPAGGALAGVARRHRAPGRAPSLDCYFGKQVCQLAGLGAMVSA